MPPSPLRSVAIALTSLAFCAAGSAASAACLGDCNSDGEVTVEELVLGVNIALGLGSASSCAALDDDRNGEVTVEEIVFAVNNALRGCLAPVPTATPTASPSPSSGPQESPTPPTGPTATFPPRPTAPAGCTNTGGYTRVRFSDAVEANTMVNRDSPLDLFGVTGVLLPQARGISASSVTCPTTLSDPIVLLKAGIAGFPQELAAGNTYPLSSAPVVEPPLVKIATLDYSERLATDPVNGRAWRAQSGTLTVDAIDGNTVRLHVDAQMAPLAGTRAQGTFRMQAATVVDKVAPN